MAKKGKGIIKMFDPERGFGFIGPEDGPDDIHFRAAVVEGSAERGLTVEYVATLGTKGQRATKVTIMDEPMKPLAEAQTGGRGGLPSNCVFSSFYLVSSETGERTLKPEIFFDAPKETAVLFTNANLTANALRMLFQGFRAFAGALNEKRMRFDKAKELFGNFYVEKVVRQNKRGMLPDIVVELFDSHKDVILSDEAEMKGFFRYLTNILCFFGDKVK
jgi:CspA family cold shock protein